MHTRLIPRPNSFDCEINGSGSDQRWPAKRIVGGARVVATVTAPISLACGIRQSRFRRFAVRVVKRLDSRHSRRICYGRSVMMFADEFGESSRAATRPVVVRFRAAIVRSRALAPAGRRKFRRRLAAAAAALPLQALHESRVTIRRKSRGEGRDSQLAFSHRKLLKTQGSVLARAEQYGASNFSPALRSRRFTPRRQRTTPRDFP